MKNVLYIGNALSSKGKTITTIETLSEQLRELCSIKIASKKTNKVHRLFDMIRLIALNKSETDYVIIDTYSTLNFYYALIISQICRVLKLSYIPILHGGKLENRLKNNPKFCKIIFKNAHKLIAPSSFLLSIFKSYGFTDVLYIPNNINIDNYNFKNREIDVIKLLWVRSFSLIYNPQLAILVLENLLKRGYKTELTMIGPDVDGSLEKVKALAESKNLDVNFTGKLSKQDWTELSKDHNVFINTTDFDNMPVTLIEAMALGLPIVSTNVGGIPFLVSDKEDAILVPPKDINAMTQAIIKLKNNRILKDKLITIARIKAEQFDWKIVKSKWAMLLS
ncbi:glycosyltransferase family 4 protein [Winogradskyella sp. PG-2]|uniref:glycosyltransferase family 4 protein n=1 Tax=Winogradskyella sp. PG-2 TaxID=754409 RepID=UPI000458712C|nr:glycosyltransferase family 4 protein [Winogradskyella sp. PG-2]BAO74390.1 glycosyl transferase, group 1 [Winogradskyella sp. PG-2]